MVTFNLLPNNLSLLVVVTPVTSSSPVLFKLPDLPQDSSTLTPMASSLQALSTLPLMLQASSQLLMAVPPLNKPMVQSTRELLLKISFLVVCLRQVPNSVSSMLQVAHQPQ